MKKEHAREREGDEIRRAGNGGPVPAEDPSPEQRREAERLGDGSPAVEPRRQEKTGGSQ